MIHEISRTKTRISKKSYAAFPKEVSEAIRAIADDYGMKSLTFIAVTPAYKWWVGEGERYTLIAGDVVRSAEVVAEHNIGAAGVVDGIGSKFQMPVGGWVLRVSYYTKYFLDVYNVQFEAMTEGAV